MESDEVKRLFQIKRERDVERNSIMTPGEKYSAAVKACEEATKEYYEFFEREKRRIIADRGLEETESISKINNEEESAH